MHKRVVGGVPGACEWMRLQANDAMHRGFVAVLRCVLKQPGRQAAMPCACMHRHHSFGPRSQACCSRRGMMSPQVWAAASGLADVKASVNWMYAAKMDAEGAAMYDAAAALRDAMLALGLACDGGKDSLSMAAAAGGETVKAPGNLVVRCLQRTYVLVVPCLYYFTSRQPV